ncbi:NTP transferase domain-containing protein [Halorubrum sp. JWXQ-INN 858]|nr:NTP transferase domain-containing protein [Halorubrum sp. JWXQ-INN 858]
MCGGRGTRLGGETEKPLVRVGGRPMIDRVLDALAGSRVERVVAVASPHTPATVARLDGRLADAVAVPLEVVVGSGEGYVADLRRGLDAVDGPAVSVVADLPLLRARDVDDVAALSVSLADGSSGPCSESTSPCSETTSPRSVSVCVPAATKRDRGVSVDTSFVHDGRTVAPAGLNVVGDGDDEVVVWERGSVAVNVNRPADLAAAREHVPRE